MGLVAQIDQKCDVYASTEEPEVMRLSSSQLGLLDISLLKHIESIKGTPVGVFLIESMIFY